MNSLIILLFVSADFALEAELTSMEGDVFFATGELAEGLSCLQMKCLTLTLVSKVLVSGFTFQE